MAQIRHCQHPAPVRHRPLQGHGSARPTGIRSHGRGHHAAACPRRLGESAPVISIVQTGPPPAAPRPSPRRRTCWWLGGRGLQNRKLIWTWCGSWRPCWADELGRSPVRMVEGGCGAQLPVRSDCPAAPCRPKLIITCGVTGASPVRRLHEHRASISSPSIRTRRPPFSAWPTTAIVGDLYQIVPRMIQKLKEERA